MTIFQPIPVYYRVTWTIDFPTDYTGSGTTAGGISPLDSLQYANTVTVSGTESSISMSTGDELYLNGYVIGPFDSGDNLSDVIDRFNLMTPYTGVMASENWNNYLTLQSIDPARQVIELQDKTGTPVEDLGLLPITYSQWKPIYGGSFGTPSNGDKIIVNGYTITFVTGALDIAGVCATINGATRYTGVIATPWTDKIMLTTQDGSPVLFGTSVGGAAADIGFADNTAYGGAMNFDEAEIIERGNLRWKGVISTVQSALSTSLWNWVALTGSTTDGNDPPTSVTWTIGVENITHVYTITTADEPEGAGEQLNGAAAIKRLVARALTRDWSENRKVYNNTIVTRGSLAARENSPIVEYVTAAAIDSVDNIDDVEGNLDVTQIASA